MNQHYVPRVYLKNFAQKRKNSFFIDAYDKHKKSFFNTNIKGICAEKDLYTLSENTTVAKEILAIENMYGRYLEPIYAKSYKILTDPRILDLTPFQNANIIVGIFQLYMRNPKWMYDSIKKHKEIIAKQLELTKSKNRNSVTYLRKEFTLNDNVEDEILDFVKSELIKAFKEKHITGTKEICEFHAESKFEIIHLVDESSFITGDNPLVGKDIINDNPHPLLRSKEFMIPLNQKVGLKLHHDNRKKFHKIYRRKGKNGDAQTFNERVINNSSRFILGTKETIKQQFELTKVFDEATDSIHKRIEIFKQVVKLSGLYDHGKEITKLMKDLIKKYEETGKITNDEEQLMYREVMKHSKKWNMENIKKRK
jgi:hypothetical protein